MRGQGPSRQASRRGVREVGHHPAAPDHPAELAGEPPGEVARPHPADAHYPPPLHPPSLAFMATAPDSLSPALERVLEKFAGVVRRVCWRYHFTGSEVDDLMQEVRIRLWHAHGGQERPHE